MPKRIGGGSMCSQATFSQITPDYVWLKDGATIPLKTVIWISGVGGESFHAELQTIRNGKVKVIPTLQSPEHPDVHVIGELAFKVKKMAIHYPCSPRSLRSKGKPSLAT